MNAPELIGLLRKLGDVPVYVRGYEGGVDDINSVAAVQVWRDYGNGPHFGAHEIIRDDDDDARAYGTAGVYLSNTDGDGVT